MIAAIKIFTNKNSPTAKTNYCSDFSPFLEQYTRSDCCRARPIAVTCHLACSMLYTVRLQFDILTFTLLYVIFERGRPNNNNNNNNNKEKTQQTRTKSQAQVRTSLKKQKGADPRTNTAVRRGNEFISSRSQ